MKISELHDKESKEMKPQTKKRKLLKKNIRVSKSERKSRVKNSCEEKSKNPRKLSEEELMERTMICGGTVVAYDRDDSSRCFLGEHLKSLVNLAIDFYNTNNLLQGLSHGVPGKSNLRILPGFFVLYDHDRQAAEPR